MELLQLNDIFLSVFRWLIGLSIGCSIGFLLALIGGLKFTNVIVRILVDFLRAIPIIGLVPVVQMNIGINEFGKIGLIAWAVMFPVWIIIRAAMDKKLESSELMLKAANKNSWSYFKLLTLPKLLSGFLKAIEVAIGIAWLAVVAAEWVGTYTQGFWAGGLGYKLTVGYNQNSWETVHLSLIIFGILGLSSAYLWRLVPNILFTKIKKLKWFNPVVKEISAI